MKRIILFGDSNTYGRIPGTETGRYDISQRWTTHLKAMLGDDWDVADEGFPGRTILPQESTPIELNGYDSLCASLSRHIPFDCLFIMLGTNDFKTKYNASPEEVIEGMKRLVKRSKEFMESNKIHAKIIIASPPVFRPVVPKYAKLFEHANEKMKAFGKMLEEYASSEDIPFLNTKMIETDKRDGIHLSAEIQPMMAGLIRDILLANKGGNQN
ncbi:MAG: hypothetical protein IAA97_01840 [Spirochaetes bacterium]|uniref:SGNH hydrolase-type esterase domain-containing protein n=1 Tax=Candidatus Ornithospirochaeta stercoripullorum TaxID=2840899 RepID=A0A9D9DY99_9SPIO|nr:hypothetical protein [Candidatus Ornithospirochaeta stercoripullorum]